MEASYKTRILYFALVMGAMMLPRNSSGADLNLADEPLFVAAGTYPNIMFLIDNSGSMNNIVPDAPFDATNVYYTCPASHVVDPTQIDRIDLYVEGDGDPYFELIQQGSDPDYRWDNAGVEPVDGGLPYRCFDPSLNYLARLNGDGGTDGIGKSPSSYLPAQYTGNYLNWYFGSAPTNWGPDARRKPGTSPRLDIAKGAAKTLVASLSAVRVGLSTYDGDNGADIRVGVDGLTSTQRTALDNTIDALTPSGSTPLAESLHDIGRYFVGESDPQYDGQLTLHPDAATPTLIDDDTVFNHSPHYASGVSTASPIQYFCQKNFAVLLTDGRPQSDQAIGNNTGLRDYDGDCPNGNDGVTCDNYDMKVGQGYESAGSDYLDDVAQALYEMDLRPDLDDLEGNEVKNNVVTYTIGFADDQVINDPLMGDTAANGGGLFLQAANSSQLAAAFEAATLDIFAQLKSSASSLAFNTGSVRAGSQIFQARFYPDEWRGELLAIALHDGSGNNGCSVSVPLGSLCPDPVWDAGCTLTGGVCDATGATIANPNLGSAREILTVNTSTRAGVPLQWTNIATDQKDALRTNAGGSLDAEVTGMARLGYLRGDRGCEEGSTGSCSYTDGTDTFTAKVFRARQSLLGDIVHGSPLYVGIPYRRYPGTWYDNLGGTLPENAGTAQAYETFKQAHNTRMTMVYTAANDGLVHGFESGKFDSNGNLQSGTNVGKELLAFMPSKALLKARFLTYSNYNHLYFIDGAPVENDVFYGDAWHSVLVGTLGVGGQGLYALDVTSPDQYDETQAANIVLWEFTDGDDADLGYQLGHPSIVRLHNGKWAVIVGNGLNSSEADGAQSPDNDSDGLPDSNAALYILFIDGPGNDGVWNLGTEYIKLDTGVGTAQDPKGQNRPNGLSTVFPVDKDGDYITDYVYAGDLFGNVWRFNLTDSSSSNWYTAEYDGDNIIDGTPAPLFSALDANGNSQPITTQLQVGTHPNGLSHGVMVYFGTGKYMETGDSLPDTITTQTFYGIWDKDFDGVGTTIDVLNALDALKKKGYARSELQQQAINAVDSTQTQTDGSVVNLDADYRRVTDNAITWDTASTTGVHGWYLDLVLSGGSNEGEMVITDPVLRGNAIVFTTLVPSDNPCVAGGAGFLMVLDRASGGRTQQSPFDVNQDHDFSIADLIDFGDSGNEVASGVNITGGTPGFILSDTKDVALIPRFDGKVTRKEMDLGVPVRGRQTWRQLR